VNEPAWRSVSHMALVTPDMDTTVRFYAGVLGMPVVGAIMAGPMRHYFFKIGEHNTVAFFEIPGMETWAKGAGSPPDRPIQFDHLAFDVADEDALLRLRKRLLEHGCEVTEIVDHGMLQSVYFTDPNGIALEASYWVEDPTLAGAAPIVEDPDPVPALRELLESGALRETPKTRLA
jgi:catechol 2,3-dioxygenase-like lactoylglutathione lyase family enzyme